ncbi:hypothetical protein FRB93_010996 [Tulasnella sp. JGI-2019a]|nr:hypothetical protein FRB93_010996 [Tulasnella sp. JGI-2019a]
MSPPQSILDEQRPFLAPSRPSESDDDHTPATLEEARTSKEPIDPKEISSRRRTVILLGIWMGTFLSALNSTMVATLLSSIASEFQSANQASWLGTSYLLATCTFTPLYGRLSNAAGRRGAFQIALFFCGVGTVCCGLSTRLEVLIITRFIAGLGGGGIFTTSSIIVSDMYSMRDRSLTQGYASIFTGMGLGLGGPFGGWVADRFGWRAAFLCQAPLFIFSFCTVTACLNYTVPGRSSSPWEVLKRIDYWGCATLLLAVASYLTFLSLRYNEDLPWTNLGVIASVLCTIILFTAFTLVELLFAKEPVLAPFLLKQRVPVLVGISNMLVSICNFSVQFYLPMWFETVQRTSVTTAGFHIMPNSISMSLGSLFSGWLMHRTGKYKTLNVTFGILPTLTALALSRLRTDSWTVTQWLTIVPLGFGNAVVLQTTLIALLASIPHSMLAVGTGFTQLFRGIGQVSGVAVSSAVFQTLLDKELHIRITGDGSDELIQKIRHSSRFVATLPEEVQILAREAYAIGLRRVFICTACAAFLGFCIRLGIPELSLDRPEDASRKTNSTATISMAAGKPGQFDRGRQNNDANQGNAEWNSDGEDDEGTKLAASRKGRRLSTYER